MYRVIYVFLIYLLSIGCSNSTIDLEYNESESTEKYNNESNDLEDTLSPFPDDTYAATVDYYNPNTGTSSIYTLDVEVVDNSVVVIHFNNGGWLDETHIVSGGELDDDGTTEILSDKGYTYSVSIEH